MAGDANDGDDAALIRKQKTTTKSSLISSSSSSLMTTLSFPHLTVLYSCVFLLFVSEIGFSYFLYSYISHVDLKCDSVCKSLSPSSRLHPETLSSSSSSSSFDGDELEDTPFPEPDSTRPEPPVPPPPRVQASSPPHKIAKRRTVVEDNTVFSEANVEFIPPQVRHEIEQKEREKESTGTPSEDSNNPWVWLTSYSRIPVSNIHEQSKFIF